MSADEGVQSIEEQVEPGGSSEPTSTQRSCFSAVLVAVSLVSVGAVALREAFS